MAELTNKQRVFVEEYLRCWNASEAARIADYAQPHSQGPRLLENVGVAAEIKARLAEKTMSADEVLVRLAEQARNDIATFLTIVEEPAPSDKTQTMRYAKLDLVKLIESGKSHLVKSVSFTNNGPKIELYDAQAALQLIGKTHGLFVDRQEVTGAGGGPIVTQSIEQDIEKVYGPSSPPTQ